jgi:ABC-type branched-subunit amino acid transport system ATPase component
MHAHTLYGSYRPFGSSIIIASHDIEGYHLHLIEPLGFNYVKNLKRDILHVLVEKENLLLRMSLKKKILKI